MFIDDTKKQKISEYLNPEGHNRKECNFFRFIQQNEHGIEVEVGYWITYIGCRPKYNKEVVFVPNDRLK